MKKTLILILALVALASAWGSGWPWYLEKCTYERSGYEYGYLGVYKQGNDYIRIWFGSQYCPYTIYR